MLRNIISKLAMEQPNRGRFMFGQTKNNPEKLFKDAKIIWAELYPYRTIVPKKYKGLLEIIDELLPDMQSEGILHVWSVSPIKDEIQTTPLLSPHKNEISSADKESAWETVQEIAEVMFEEAQNQRKKIADDVNLLLSPSSINSENSLDADKLIDTIIQLGRKGLLREKINNSSPDNSFSPDSKEGSDEEFDNDHTLGINLVPARLLYEAPRENQGTTPFHRIEIDLEIKGLIENRTPVSESQNRNSNSSESNDENHRTPSSNKHSFGNDVYSDSSRSENEHSTDALIAAAGYSPDITDPKSLAKNILYPGNADPLRAEELYRILFDEDISNSPIITRGDKSLSDLVYRIDCTNPNTQALYRQKIAFISDAESHDSILDTIEKRPYPWQLKNKTGDFSGSAQYYLHALYKGDETVDGTAVEKLALIYLTAGSYYSHEPCSSYFFKNCLNELSVKLESSSEVIMRNLLEKAFTIFHNFLNAEPKDKTAFGYIDYRHALFIKNFKNLIKECLQVRTKLIIHAPEKLEQSCYSKNKENSADFYFTILNKDETAANDEDIEKLFNQLLILKYIKINGTKYTSDIKHQFVRLLAQIKDNDLCDDYYTFLAEQKSSKLILSVHGKIPDFYTEIFKFIVKNPPHDQKIDNLLSFFHAHCTESDTRTDPRRRASLFYKRCTKIIDELFPSTTLYATHEAGLTRDKAKFFLSRLEITLFSEAASDGTKTLIHQIEQYEENLSKLQNDNGENKISVFEKAQLNMHFIFRAHQNKTYLWSTLAPTYFHLLFSRAIPSNSSAPHYALALALLLYFTYTNANKTPTKYYSDFFVRYSKYCAHLATKKLNSIQVDGEKNLGDACLEIIEQNVIPKIQEELISLNKYMPNSSSDINHELIERGKHLKHCYFSDNSYIPMFAYKEKNKPSPLSSQIMTLCQRMGIASTD